MVKKRTRYLVFDNVNRIVYRKVFRKIVGVMRVLKEYVRVVMICNGCIPKLSFFDEFMATDQSFFPIYMPPPSKDHLKTVLRDKISEIANPEVYSLFIDLLYSEYSQYTTHIHYYLYLSKAIIPMLLKENDLERVEDVKKAYNRRFRHIGKWFIANLYLPIDGEDIDVEDVYYRESELDVQGSFATDECLKYAKEVKYGLTYLEGVLLISTYIACHNPVQSDKKIFFRTKR
eukprot:TRINITY_DN7100_c0_g2_i1.p1 TRINITY_DN7100_c0_g2~~TRINITY_DN7100_c0_g2_i1.p1  ORF type:complete len:231 (+),score=68.79 TRINITY_DN7100_c0_g2_i1:549-1241(+)